MSEKNELILARKATGLRNISDWRVLKEYHEIPVHSELNVIMRREDLEQNMDYRHYITYVSVWNEHGEVLVYRRTKQSGEKTLVGQASIGFGGHVELEDLALTPKASFGADSVRYGELGIDVANTLYAAMHREICEELGPDASEAVDTLPDFDLDAQWIVGHETATDRLHLGLHMKILVKEADIAIDSPIGDHQFIGWMSPKDAITKVDNIENWSTILLESFID